METSRNTVFVYGSGLGGGGVPLGILGGVLQILPLFQAKKCDFPYQFSDIASKIHARFQTWSLRNRVFITYNVD